MVGGPADDVARVFGDQLFTSAAQVDAIDVKYFGVAPVVADQDVVRVVGQVIEQFGTHLVARCQVGHLAGFDVDGHHMKVLVTTKVLGVEDAMAAFPVVNADVARRLASQTARLAHRCAALECLHKHVHAPRRAID
jgi:hypothetical protein